MKLLFYGKWRDAYETKEVRVWDSFCILCKLHRIRILTYW